MPWLIYVRNVVGWLRFFLEVLQRSFVFRLHPIHLSVDPAPAYEESPDLMIGT